MKTKKPVEAGMENTRPRLSRKTTTKKEEANKKKVAKRVRKGSGRRSRTELSTQEAEAIKKQQSPSEFGRVFLQYDESMRVIREFFSELSPYISEMEEGISKSRTEILEEKVKSLWQDFNQSATLEDKEELNKLLENISKQIPKAKLPTKLLRGQLRPLVAQLMDDLFKLARHMRTLPLIRHELLNRGILMCLVSYFEVLISDLVHLYYGLVPDATSTNDKVISVNELREFSSIDDAFQFVISRRVDDLLRGSIFDWHDFFKTRVKIDLNGLVPNVAEWNEFFQRRHIMVHAGGRVTKRYLANVDWGELVVRITRPEIGEQLGIDDSYLERAINAFEIAGLLLCQECWKKYAIQEHDIRMSREGGLTGAVYQRLLSGNWYVAEHLADWGSKDSDADESSILVCLFNRWLCIKRQGRWAEVADEVEAFDTAAKQLVFSLVKASLLEKADDFFKLLPLVIDTGMSIDSAKEWPSLEEMRTDPRFAEFIEAAEKEAAQ